MSQSRLPQFAAVLRILLAALLLSALALVPRPRAVLAAVSFADRGALGMTAVRDSALAWGDCDNDGDLDLALAGCSSGDCSARLTPREGITIAAACWERWMDGGRAAGYRGL